MAPAAKAKCLDGGSFSRFLGRDKRKKKEIHYTPSLVLLLFCAVSPWHVICHMKVSEKRKENIFYAAGDKGREIQGEGKQKKPSMFPY